jgi:hypothetical protein
MGCVDFRVPEQEAVTEIAKWMDQNGDNYQIQKYLIVICQSWTIREFVRARWVPLLYSADETADEDQDCKPHNKYPVVLCDKCRWFDEAVVPTPYRISTSVLKRKEEVFRARNGLLIANRRVKDLLAELIAGEIEWGKTTFASSKDHAVNPTEKREFYWIRPKYLIGKSMYETPDSPCPKCGIPLACGDYPNGGRKVVPISPLVEHFGDKRLNIACSGTWTGRRDSPSEAVMAREIVVSGGLYAYLYNSGLKGFVFPEHIVFSARGEPPIEETRRFGDLKTGKEDRILRKSV